MLATCRPIWTLIGRSAAGLALVLGCAVTPASQPAGGQSPQALYALAERHVEAKRYREAAATLDRALQADPGSWRAWALLGFCRLKERRFDDALEACSKALELKPDDPGARLRRAVCLKELRRFDEATPAYQALLDSRPGRQVEIECHWGLAECAQAGDDTETAVRHVREVTRRDGRRGRLLDATLRLRRGDIEEACKRFERLFSADDEDPRILYGLAACLLKLNRDHEFALRLLDKAQGAPELDPIDVVLRRAQALVKLSRFDEARDVLAKVDADAPLTDEQKELHDETVAAVAAALGT